MHRVFLTWTIKEAWFNISNRGTFKIASSSKINVINLMRQKKENRNMYFLPIEFSIGIGTGWRHCFSKIFSFLLVILPIILINLHEVLLQCKCSRVLIYHLYLYNIYFCSSRFNYSVQETGKRRRPIKLVFPILLSIGHRIYNTIWKSSNSIKHRY